MFSRSTDLFQTGGLAIIHLFASRAFGRSNGYHKECFCVRGHILHIM